MWNMGYKWTYLQNKHTDIENKLTATEGQSGRRRQLGGWYYQIHTAIYNTDKQQGPTV